MNKLKSEIDKKNKIKDENNKTSSKITMLDQIKKWWEPEYTTAAVAFLGAIVGGCLAVAGSMHLYDIQKHDEQKNIAKAIEIDLDSINNSLVFSPYYYSYKTDCPINEVPTSAKFTLTQSSKSDLNNSSEDYYKPSRSVVYPATPFYDSRTCLYFVFDHDIYILNYDLSSEIYQFYTDLFQAESDRIYISTVQMTDNYTNNTKISRYGEMKYLIIKCGDEIPKIEENLSKFQN